MIRIELVAFRSGDSRRLNIIFRILYSANRNHCVYLALCDWTKETLFQPVRKRADSKLRDISPIHHCMLLQTPVAHPDSLTQPTWSIDLKKVVCCKFQPETLRLNTFERLIHFLSVTSDRSEWHRLEDIVCSGASPTSESNVNFTLSPLYQVEWRMKKNRKEQKRTLPNRVE